MSFALSKTLTQQSQIITTSNSDAVSIDSNLQGLGIIATATDNTPSAITFDGSDAAVVIVASDIIVKASHGFTTGLKVAATTAGTLPTGLSATNYYVIVVSATQIKLATSLANAQAGTAVDITAVGVGNSTLTPAALAGATYQLQVSNDNSIWANYGSTSAISATGNTALEMNNINFAYVRVQTTLTAGRLTIDLVANSFNRLR